MRRVGRDKTCSINGAAFPFMVRRVEHDRFCSPVVSIHWTVYQRSRFALGKKSTRKETTKGRSDLIGVGYAMTIRTRWGSERVDNSHVGYTGPVRNELPPVETWSKEKHTGFGPPAWVRIMCIWGYKISLIR